MAQIMHGRRTGQSKSAPSGPSYNPDNPERYMDEANRAGKGPALPNGTDLRHVAILGKEDWNRIQYQLHKGKIEEEQARVRREGRADLYQKSKEKVKLWTNTIDGHRKKKLEARKIRMQAEEEQKQALDIEHKKFVAQMRKEAIEKAKLQQYYQTDRVKGFHSALLMTECLKERDAQVELNKLQKAAQEGQDRVWVDLQQKNLEDAVLEDQNEARKRFQKNKDAQRFQAAQIRYHLKLEEKRRMEAQIEGEELEKLSIQFVKEKQRMAEIQAAEAKQLLADNLKQRNDVKRMNELIKLQDDEEDEECRVFAAAKTKMMKLRAEKERELHMAQQRRLDNIRGKLTSEMQEKMDDEEERMKRAIREAEAKKEAEEKGKAEWRSKMRDEIAAHRDKAMREKEQEKRDKRKRDLEELIAKREAALVFAKNEEAKMQRRRAEAHKLSKIHIEQASEKKRKEIALIEEDLAYAKKDLEICEAEEKQFQEYAKKVIDYADENGRPTHVLKRAAQAGAGGGLGPIFPGKGGVRPSYMASDVSGTQLPSFQRGSTDEVKQTVYGKATSGTRLGFGWDKK